MKRNDLKVLYRWIAKPGRKPLVLRGARQVGKSTLVRIFAEEAGYDLVEVNLELHRNLDDLFKRLDIDEIVGNLQYLTKKKLGDKSILFLDEIQASPHALAVLRYFYELKPDIPVIAAGSLLEFALKDHSFSMPVGRIQYLHMGPMSFLEFLELLEPDLYELLIHYSLNDSIPETAHRRLLKIQRDYMLTGGMPEAVQVFLNTGSFDEVKTVLESINNTYIDDFSKYARSRELADLQQIFRTVPGLIGRKVKYTHYLPDAKSSYTSSLLEMLHKARIILKVHAADLSGIPLAAGRKNKIFKLLFLDIGLLCNLLGLDIIDVQNVFKRELINEGALAEQFIGQQLRFQSGLFYWVRESSKSNAEVDFAVSKGSMIVPVEVKAGKTGSLKSLHQLMYEKKLDYAFRFDLQLPSVQRVSTRVSTKSGLKESSYTLISLPLYAVELLPELIDQIRTET
ncbi:MAG: ATP-binding protein [Spirochaetales bacterium]|nr:ATP-binding protein [Spirochaetales bacterium]